ncbi:aldose 1-epimerase family protein [Pseudokineococcus basanitobsidens]|uniref:Aldose 1-epimerase family protein n=1 Tax=Pseudokineococcus basanitobsidens TaxID=1926649 RepID=A0ABU8RGS1_9ACTN
MHPSGEQHLLEHGSLRAVVTQVGASLRSLTDDGRDLVVPFGADEVRPVFRGAVLAPWPNRVVDGRWRADGVGSASGVEQQLALTEPARGHALHGLLAWAPFTRTGTGGDEDGATLQLAARVWPQAGYPFAVDVVVGYALSDVGLTTTVTGTGAGDDPAPWGCAAHPYLTTGSGRVDDWTAHADAASYLEALGERMLPGQVRPVAGTHRDLRGGRPLAGVELDDALTDVRADPEDGLAHVGVVGPDGLGSEVVWDPAVLPWVQVHTADRPEPDLDRAGLAVEPMTCPPDALNSGTGLVRLARGESASATWTIRPLRRA